MSRNSAEPVYYGSNLVAIIKLHVLIKLAGLMISIKITTLIYFAYALVSNCSYFSYSIIFMFTTKNC